MLVVVLVVVVDDELGAAGVVEAIKAPTNSSVVSVCERTNDDGGGGVTAADELATTAAADRGTDEALLSGCVGVVLGIDLARGSEGVRYDSSSAHVLALEFELPDCTADNANEELAVGEIGRAHV